MASTWMKALHRANGKSTAAALDKNADYILDHNKTDNGRLVDSYECQSFTSQSEFLFSKQLYEQKTGRNQGKNDVIAYHLRMSFKPGEVSAEQALELGKELALRWTKGKHQCLVAAHTNTNNLHCHIIYNSVNLDCTGKYQDFKRSAIALRRLSDQVCLEHGLSVIENPGLSKGFNRTDYLGCEKDLSVRDKLRAIIDANLVQGMDFGKFLSSMKSAGCEVKRGKHLGFKIPVGKRFIRCDSLGDDYSEDAIIERLSGKRVVEPKGKTIAAPSVSGPNLLIDIQAKIQQGYGAGFGQWAKVQNLKDAAKTLIFLQERGLDDYDLLTEKTVAITKKFNGVSNSIKAIESRQKEIADLQKQIGAYSKTKDIYAAYKNLKFSKKFYAENESAIIICKAAKKYFDEHGYGKDKKLPTIKMLQTEYATLAADVKKIYAEYKANREEMIALKMAKQNVDMILGEPRQTSKSHEYGER